MEIKQDVPIGRIIEERFANGERQLSVNTPFEFRLLLWKGFVGQNDERFRLISSALVASYKYQN